MPTPPLDLLVIGCGTAGAAVARAAACAGLRVTAVEKRPLHQAGARWLNGVPRAVFAQGGLAEPAGAERAGPGGRFHLIAGMGPTRVTLPAHDLLDVDMRLLVARLQADATAAGASLLGQRAVVEISALDDAAQVRLSDGTQLQAAVVVDASGLGGVGFDPAPQPGAAELCVAAQGVFAVRDAEAAAAFCARHGVAPGETAVFTGVSGGYSIINLRVELEDPEGPSVALLTGGLPGRGFASGPAMQAKFCEEHPWIGPQRFGGARAIPIGPPLGRLHAGRMLRFGDAAGMVFAVHGSGIGLQLVAAADLAAQLAAGSGLDQWTARFHQRWGGDLCAGVAFARMSAALAPADLRTLFGSGLAPPGLMLRGLLQQPMRAALDELPGLALSALRHPGLVARLAPTLARMQALGLHHRSVPSDAAAFDQWLARRDALLGPAPADLR